MLQTVRSSNWGHTQQDGQQDGSGGKVLALVNETVGNPCNNTVQDLFWAAEASLG